MSQRNPDLERIIAEKRQCTESILARALLSSERKPRAKVMCRDGHLLAALYERDECAPIVVFPLRLWQERHVFRDSTYPARQVVMVEWATAIDEDSDNTVYLLRCRCHSYQITAGRLRDQMARLGDDDHWVLPSGISRLER